jgi:hypothetical protein
MSIKTLPEHLKMIEEMLITPVLAVKRVETIAYLCPNNRYWIARGITIDQQNINLFQNDGLPTDLHI